MLRQDGPGDPAPPTVTALSARFRLLHSHPPSPASAFRRPPGRPRFHGQFHGQLILIEGPRIDGPPHPGSTVRRPWTSDPGFRPTKGSGRCRREVGRDERGREGEIGPEFGPGGHTAAMGGPFRRRRGEGRGTRGGGEGGRYSSSSTRRSGSSTGSSACRACSARTSTVSSRAAAVMERRRWPWETVMARRRASCSSGESASHRSR